MTIVGKTKEAHVIQLIELQQSDTAFEIAFHEDDVVKSMLVYKIIDIDEFRLLFKNEHGQLKTVIIAKIESVNVVEESLEPDENLIRGNPIFQDIPFKPAGVKAPTATDVQDKCEEHSKHIRDVMSDFVSPDKGKQSRYQDSQGEDWIDEFARTSTDEEFRGAMRFTIGKYNRRMGKKDDVVKEIEKMRDYCGRWLTIEESK